MDVKKTEVRAPRSAGAASVNSPNNPFPGRDISCVPKPPGGLRLSLWEPIGSLERLFERVVYSKERFSCKRWGEVLISKKSSEAEKEKALGALTLQWNALKETERGALTRCTFIATMLDLASSKNGEINKQAAVLKLICDSGGVDVWRDKRFLKTVKLMILQGGLSEPDSCDLFESICSSADSLDRSRTAYRALARILLDCPAEKRPAPLVLPVLEHLASYALGDYSTEQNEVGVDDFQSKDVARYAGLCKGLPAIRGVQGSDSLNKSARVIMSLFMEAHRSGICASRNDEALLCGGILEISVLCGDRLKMSIRSLLDTAADSSLAIEERKAALREYFDMTQVLSAVGFPEDFGYRRLEGQLPSDGRKRLLQILEEEPRLLDIENIPFNFWVEQVLEKPDFSGETLDALKARYGGKELREQVRSSSPNDADRIRMFRMMFDHGMLSLGDLMTEVSSIEDKQRQDDIFNEEVLPLLSSEETVLTAKERFFIALHMEGKEAHQVMMAKVFEDIICDPDQDIVFRGAALQQLYQAAHLEKSERVWAFLESEIHGLADAEFSLAKIHELFLMTYMLELSGLHPERVQAMKEGFKHYLSESSAERIQRDPDWLTYPIFSILDLDALNAEKAETEAGRLFLASARERIGSYLAKQDKMTVDVFGNAFDVFKGDIFSILDELSKEGDSEMLSLVGSIKEGIDDSIREQRDERMEVIRQEAVQLRLFTDAYLGRDLSDASVKDLQEVRKHAEVLMEHPELSKLQKYAFVYRPMQQLFDRGDFDNNPEMLDYFFGLASYFYADPSELSSVWCTQETLEEAEYVLMRVAKKLGVNAKNVRYGVIHELREMRKKDVYSLTRMRSYYMPMHDCRVDWVDAEDEVPISVRWNEDFIVQPLPNPRIPDVSYADFMQWASDYEKEVKASKQALEAMKVMTGSQNLKYFMGDAKRSDFKKAMSPELVSGIFVDPTALSLRRIVERSQTLSNQPKEGEVLSPRAQLFQQLLMNCRTCETGFMDGVGSTERELPSKIPGAVDESVLSGKSEEEMRAQRAREAFKASYLEDSVNRRKQLLDGESALTRELAGLSKEQVVSQPVHQTWMMDALLGNRIGVHREGDMFKIDRYRYCIYKNLYRKNAFLALSAFYEHYDVRKEIAYFKELWNGRLEHDAAVAKEFAEVRALKQERSGLRSLRSEEVLTSEQHKRLMELDAMDLEKREEEVEQEPTYGINKQIMALLKGEDLFNAYDWDEDYINPQGLNDYGVAKLMMAIGALEEV